jgi:AcrR family transcriptional regulator
MAIARRAVQLEYVSKADDDSGRQHSRRAQIVETLRKCILKKGYADTTLTDLARGSGLSVSHLLYYFPSREAVLEKLCRDFLGGLSTEFKRHRAKPPAEQIRVLVDQIFAGKAAEASDLKIGLEFVALSIHRPVIRETLRKHSHSMMQNLTDLFSKVPLRGGISAEEAARVAAGLRFGLFTNSIFDDVLDNQYARRVFRRLFLAVADMSDPYVAAESSNGGDPRAAVNRKRSVGNRMKKGFAAAQPPRMTIVKSRRSRER